ncbi:TonB-dependent receptor [Microbulbifer spongiae]|uniref:TonB-dependent receptor n=1 Tax=Microbulbifer spongiae TaxID=2944933 RepID=A0ABY9EHX9_9GAMM|nr:TonB-dependent receptor [Microbulbifer sp. MI-G]WKD51544.1 TonB-dependent receptor [Microbulbifer sp. MI-G]
METTNTDSLSDTELEVVVVTARHSKENARDIPFSVNAIDGDTLQNRLLLNVEDALRSVPGVDVYSSSGAVDANIRIRGVGSLTQVNKDDGSVVVNIDGVSMPAGNVSLGTLDIDRLEILKGPQGTLFGRNSEAGAINIITNKPTRDLEAYGRIEAGEQSQRLYEAVVSGPFSDSLSGRLAVRHTSEDHWIENITNGDPMTQPDALAFRGSLLWDLSPDTSALVIAERQHQEGFLNLQLLQPFTDNPGSEHTPGVFDNNNKTIERFSIEINHQWNRSQLTAITALVNTDFDYLTGFDSTTAGAVFNFPVEYLRGDQQEERTISQDLRLSSLPEATSFWVVGVNLSQAERSFDSMDLIRSSSQDRDYDTDSQAVYGELTLPLSDAIKFTAGLRYTRDSKTYVAEYTSFIPAIGEFVQQDQRNLDDNYATGRLALSYAVSDSTNIYTVAARGYKAGGFNDFATQPLDSLPYRPAKVDTLEVGFKSESERLRLEGAVFFNQADDDHLIGFDFVTFATNAVNADTETFGAELEGSWLITEGFSVAAGLSFLDTAIINDVPGVSGGFVAAGNEVPDVPRWSTNLSLNFYRPLPDFMGLQAPALNASVNYRYVDERPADPQNHFDLTAYDKLDLRLALQTEHIEVYLWADNLLDEQYELYGYVNSDFAPTARIGAPARDRLIGLGAIYTF